MLFKDCATALASKLQGTRAKAESSAADGAGHQNWPWQDCRALSLRNDLYLTYAHYCWLWERMELIFKSLHISCKVPLATCKDWTPIWNVLILLPKAWAESRWLGSRSLKLAQRMNLNRWRRLITVSSYYFMHAFQALQWPPGVSTFAIVWGSFLYGFLESLGEFLVVWPKWFFHPFTIPKICGMQTRKEPFLWLRIPNHMVSPLQFDNTTQGYSSQVKDLLSRKLYASICHIPPWEKAHHLQKWEGAWSCGHARWPRPKVGREGQGRQGRQGCQGGGMTCWWVGSWYLGKSLEHRQNYMLIL